MIAALADRTVLAEGWRRGLIAVVAGALGALTQPPIGFWPALALSLAPAVWLLDGSLSGGRWPFLGRIARAAGAGWCWGLGYFTAGLWWIGAAFLVEADQFAWLMPFGVLGLPALLAAFPALGFALARAIWSDGPARFLALAAALTVSEWLRSVVLTGFPWNTIGLALGQNAWLMQTASLVGIWGLTLVAVGVGASAASLGTGESRVARLGPPLGAAVLLLAMTGFGAWRLAGADDAVVPGVKLRLMQPNLPQDAKFRPSAGDEILDRYLALSDRATSPGTRGLADVTHLVWPESAFPFLLHREPNALARIAAALGGRTVLLTGAARQGEPLPGETGRTFFNSIQAVGPDGAIVATYDKVHLVPFGEYVPAFLDRSLRALGIRQFVHIPGGFTPGARRTAMAVPGLPLVAGSVCYEIIFPAEVVAPGRRPGLVLNVTNDGWFGDTAGPRQHFAQARLRAVELGLPVVRAANTGISAVVDGYGRVRARLDVGVEGVLDSALPEALSPTPFATYGNLTLVLLCTVCLFAAIARRRRSG